MRRNDLVRLLVVVVAGVLLVSVFSTIGILAGRGGTPTPAATPTDTPSPTPPPTGQLGKLQLALAPFATGLNRPDFLTNAGDGSGRVYVTEQGGRIMAVEANGQVHTQPFLDIRPIVRMQAELGLMGLAFSPRYKANGLFYVSYSNLDGDTVIARYHVARDSPLRADPTSAQIILTIEEPDIPEHKSGMLAFGRDGYLYIGVGDGGRGAPGANGQRKDTLLGKILRIDVDHTSSGKAYAIPPTNPFAHDPSARPEIWAYGMRNPWRFGFDRATGDLYVGDVGDSSHEEIDFQPAASHGGENYGWKVYEGNGCLLAKCLLPDYSAPIAAYNHTGGLCAAIGGYVYRGKRNPALQGVYLFGDVCSGRVFGLVAAGNAPGSQAQYRQLAAMGPLLSAFGEDEAGELYVLNLTRGTVYRVTAK